MKILETIQEHMITHLLGVCKRELEIDELPPIRFINEPTIPGGTSFGVFDGESVLVVVKNRHPMDVARTLAHELTHWQQKITGQDLDGATGSNTENDANAIAGVILRKFGEMYPQYFTDILP